MKYTYLSILAIAILNGCIGNDNDTTDSVLANVTLPTTYSANDGRLLASSCFQCHGTNGVSTNDWDSLSADEMDEIIGEHPLMDAIGVGYTQDEIIKMTQWLSTMPNSGDEYEYENDDKYENEGDDDD